MARNNELTPSQIVHETLIGLGESAIEVELAPGDVEKCMKDAVREYSRVLPLRRQQALSITKDQKQYKISTVDHPGLLGVVDVQFVSDTYVDSRLDPFNFEEQTVAGLTALGGETFGEVYQRRAYLDDSRRAVSAEPEWTADWSGDGNFYLYIDVVHTPMLCTYWWVSAYAPNADDANGMQWIPASDVQWILDFTSARAKQILARIRGKHGGIVTPDGGTDQLDYQEMFQDGKETEAELRAALEQRRRTVAPDIL